MVMTDVPTKLDYLINDADEHSTPRPKAYEDYIDPDKRDMAIRTVTPRRRTPPAALQRAAAALHVGKNFQVVGSNDTLDELGVKERRRKSERRRRGRAVDLVPARCSTG